MPETPKKSGVVVPEKPTGLQRFAAWIIFLFIRAISLTLRYRWIDSSGLVDGTRPHPAIYCIWHNRLFLSMIAYFDFIRHHDRSAGLAAMVSASKDGGFLTGVLERFGVQPVRGSTSRRGPQALRELAGWTRKQYTVAITPDGPRGPRYQVQEGVVALAQLTGLPIVPVSFNLVWKIKVKSWDEFQIPLPFSRCEMVFGSALIIPRTLSEAERETWRKTLNERLNAITED